LNRLCPSRRKTLRALALAARARMTAESFMPAAYRWWICGEC
jgi:hypothetical protein